VGVADPVVLSGTAAGHGNLPVPTPDGTGQDQLPVTGSNELTLLIAALAALFLGVTLRRKVRT